MPKKPLAPEDIVKVPEPCFVKEERAEPVIVPAKVPLLESPKVKDSLPSNNVPPEGAEKLPMVTGTVAVEMSKVAVGDPKTTNPVEEPAVPIPDNIMEPSLIVVPPL